MFIDIKSNDGGRGEPYSDVCVSCQRLIEPHHSTEHIDFQTGDEKLTKLNGIYHAKCAVPYLSIKRALDMMNRMIG
ncbi:hypothetical protein GRI89_11845 [Altererythrobacter salegens]|uniref:Uncharacterized protein n=1 Tax=Croceibacterium salegens TaxID=1737568 RepID=A0A6I4SW59_9SPHN|nr:hypothetical protein [Croceibacterium salegens]MXO60231.1 hypothetical protein [Croceibacterium salegens]